MAQNVVPVTLGSPRFNRRDLGTQPRGSDTLVTAMEFEQAGRWTLISEAVLVRKR